MSALTSASANPNWNLMASKGVRSSHAISMILSIWLSVRGSFVLGALMMGFTLFIVCDK